MNTFDRRQFLIGTAAGMAGTSLSAFAADPKTKPLLYKLGMVTYNVAKDWDLPTILKICKEVGIASVELSNHSQARRRAEPYKEEREGCQQAICRQRCRLLGLRQCVRISIARSRYRQKEHRRLQVIRRSGQGSWRSWGQSKAQQFTQGCSGRENLGADWQGAH